MIRLLAACFDRLDAIYRDRPHFAGVKARLLVTFVLLLLVFVPVNVAKMLWVQPPAIPTRLLLNLILLAAGLAAWREVWKGRLERAGNGLAFLMIVPVHVIGMYLAAPYAEPVSGGVQMLVFDLAFLLLATIFASRRVAIFLLVFVVASHLAFYRIVLQPQPLAGSLAFAADTLARDGLIAIFFVFSLGITLIHMIETAHGRSEEALRQTRALNENLEQLVSQRTRDLEAATRRATEASRAKSEFLANLSHEIRTPLNGVIALADLMRHRRDLPPEAAEQARLIASSGDLLLKLLGNVLDFSKIEAGQLALERRPFGLVAMVSDTVALVQPQAALGAVRLDLDLDPALPSQVEGDSHRLRQILLNLLSNAIKFTPAGGRVVVAVTPAASGAKPARIRFEVRDSGIGMDAAALGRIFERFMQADSSTTRRYGGSGLGLAISSRLVQLMGSRLEVESAPDQGSIFHFTLALPTSAARPEPPAVPDEAAVGLDLRVLVVEDNAVNQKIIAAQLTRLRCPHVLANGGEEALAALQTEALPDVILMDCHMPGLDGCETTRRIRGWADDPDSVRRKVSAIPIVALTAAALPEERARCLDAGMNDFLAKPLKLAELQQALEPYATGGRRRPD